MHEIIAPLNWKGGLYLGSIKAVWDYKGLKDKNINCVMTIVKIKDY